MPPSERASEAALEQREYYRTSLGTTTSAGDRAPLSARRRHSRRLQPIDRSFQRRRHAHGQDQEPGWIESDAEMMVPRHGRFSRPLRSNRMSFALLRVQWTLCDHRASIRVGRLKASSLEREGGVAQSSGKSEGDGACVNGADAAAAGRGLLLRRRRPPNDSLSGERGVGGYERTIYASVGRAFDRTAAGSSCYSTPTKLGSPVQD